MAKAAAVHSTVGSLTPIELEVGSAAVSRAELVARHIASGIRSGGLAPGSKLGTKNELAERYRVAYGTLNEAIRLLESRGLIEARPGPGGGVFAAEPSARLRLSHMTLGFKSSSVKGSDCLAIRNALEGLVCSEAASHYRAADLKDLYSLVDAMAACAGDPLASLRANWAIHRRLAQITPNELLREIYESLLDFLESDVREADRTLPHPPRGVEVHRELIDAVASRDLDKVHQAVHEHSQPIRPR